MGKSVKICRVCGKEYEACRSANVSGLFRWQDVSCSPECGAEYLRRINLSRMTEKSDVNIIYNEDIYGFEGEVDEEYMSEFGADE